MAGIDAIGKKKLNPFEWMLMFKPGVNLNTFGGYLTENNEDKKKTPTIALGNPNAYYGTEGTNPLSSTPLPNGCT